MNDTDKNMGATDSDKEDVIFECVRQLGDRKIILKNFISEIQNKLKRVVESHLYNGNCTKKEAEFLMSIM